MREVLILSGKGGTGKTSVTAAFAHLSCDAVLCDLDVDAPDLHLILRPEISERNTFSSGGEAVIREERCTNCGTCGDLCRFGAVLTGDSHPRVDPIRCEGCKVCVHFCPEDAIDFVPRDCGEWSIGRTRFGPMVHAQLFPGEENSGKLVALLRQEAKRLAKSREMSLILSDGPPGIGCPVISSVSGQDTAVLVTEPTPSGLHDLERVARLCRHFRLPAAVLINKYDLNERGTQRIRDYCKENDIPVVGELPYDPSFVDAMVAGQALTEYADGVTAGRLRDTWRRIQQLASLQAAA